MIQTRPEIRVNGGLQRGWTVAPAGQVDPAAVLAGYRRLAIEALAQAARDAKGRGERARAARCWLARDGLTWFEMTEVGVQPGAFTAWLESLPPLRPAPAWRGALIGLLHWEIKAYGYRDSA
jgi:hypothetical protein